MEELVSRLSVSIRLRSRYLTSEHTFSWAKVRELTTSALHQRSSPSLYHPSLFDSLMLIVDGCGDLRSIGCSEALSVPDAEVNPGLMRDISCYTSFPEEAARRGRLSLFKSKLPFVDYKVAPNDLCKRLMFLAYATTIGTPWLLLGLEKYFGIRSSSKMIMLVLAILADLSVALMGLMLLERKQPRFSNWVRTGRLWGKKLSD